ncbi:hypothetical protein Ahy_B06g080546 [Arachis hypogaea]|uniref:UspA domain-containing protein n=1 Tax=Arachis hypogaea TaxID=3818 RepID=A0A444YI97_ARAHY|nr:hypothetical protein Ahy_B06g080546 [Arachis hypogaea]
MASCCAKKVPEREKQVLVVGVDDSEYSTYALEWTLDHLITPSPTPIFKLVIVFAKPSVTSAVGIIGPGMYVCIFEYPSMHTYTYVYAYRYVLIQVVVGAPEVFPMVEADIKRTAARVTEQAKQLCINKSVNDAIVEVVEGDPRNVLCEAVEKHHASVLVVGSHGYGAIKRAVLGSVSDYCAHHAHCTVMIVKKPKTKH